MDITNLLCGGNYTLQPSTYTYSLTYNMHAAIHPDVLYVKTSGRYLCACVYAIQRIIIPVHYTFN